MEFAKNLKNLMLSTENIRRRKSFVPALTLSLLILSGIACNSAGRGSKAVQDMTADEYNALFGVTPTAQVIRPVEPQIQIIQPTPVPPGEGWDVGHQFDPSRSCRDMVQPGEGVNSLGSRVLGGGDLSKLGAQAILNQLQNTAGVKGLEVKMENGEPRLVAFDEFERKCKVGE